MAPPSQVECWNVIFLKSPISQLSFFQSHRYARVTQCFWIVNLQPYFRKVSCLVHRCGRKRKWDYLVLHQLTRKLVSHYPLRFHVYEYHSSFSLCRGSHKRQERYRKVGFDLGRLWQSWKVPWRCQNLSESNPEKTEQHRSTCRFTSSNGKCCASLIPDEPTWSTFFSY